MIWRDPILPVIAIPEDLKTKQFRLGSYRYSLLPKQYEFLSAHEEFKRGAPLSLAKRYRPA